jgi:hypothetical protein
MHCPKYKLPWLVVLTSLSLQSFLQGQERAASVASDKAATAAESSTEFLRIRLDENGDPAALQTAIVRYRNKKRTLLVDLIGAVHIGEGSYYKQLNNQFDQYESLLYELVAPQGTRVPKGERKASSNPISFLQNSAQSMLGLESQLELIDYQKDNFVHADLSPAEMQEKMAERGDTALTLGLSAVADMLRQQNLAQKQSSESNSLTSGLTEESLFEVMGNPVKMKRMMANQFASSGALEMGLGAKLNELVVTDRNIAAMKVLKREIVDGKTKLALFYGAAHMPDFEERLAELGLEPTEHVWVDAWDLTQSNAKAVSGSNAASLMMKLLESLDQ